MQTLFCAKYHVQYANHKESVMRELSIYDFLEHSKTNLNALAKVLGVSRQRLEYWAKNEGVVEFSKDNRVSQIKMSREKIMWCA
jgi:hypothetical protein